MKNLVKLVGIIALVALIGFTMGGCSITIPGLMTVNYPGGTTPAVQGPTLDGVWKYGTGHGGSFTINTSTGTGVYYEIDSGSAWQNTVVRQGLVKVGDVGLRNLTKTGDLTWTGEMQQLSGSSLIWRRCNITLSADGQTFREESGTWYRR